MRADRLLSMLLLLQSRGRMTAQELAGELEVSERTIYRDIEALSFAGIPVYTERGSGGGCALLDNYRTTLTGLTDKERRALLTISITTPLTDIAHHLKNAFLKLATAKSHLMAKFEPDIHLDFNSLPQPYLQKLYQAIQERKKLHLRYRLLFDAIIQHTVAPYGLVARSDSWYLIGARDEHLHVYTVSHILDITLLEECFERPSNFDLTAFWKDWTERVNPPVYPVRLRVAPDLMPLLKHLFGTLPTPLPLPDSEDWFTLTLTFPSLESARMTILGFGRAAEVLEPVALRKSIRDFAEQIVAFYNEKNTRTFDEG